MGILNKAAEKIKGMFVEEINEPKVEIKKEVIKVEIPSPETEIKKEQEELPKKEEVIVPEEPPKKEEKVKFPIYFDDDDFASLKEEDNIKEEANYEDNVRTSFKRENLMHDTYNRDTYNDERKPSFRDVYGRQKEETSKSYGSSAYHKDEPKKVFKPTPIISPVYGILDKNYSKEDIAPRKPTRLSSELTSDKVTIDDVRKKAYGTLEDDIETSLLGQFDNIEDNTSEELFDDLEEENSNNIMADELLNSFDDEYDDSFTKNVLDDIEEPTENIEETLSRDYDDVEEPKKKKRTPKKEVINEENKEDEDIDMTESELFNLIDSWYEKRDEE